MATVSFPVRDYDLDATMDCGQAFRWRQSDAGWTGIIGTRWVRLRLDASGITAEAIAPVADWCWLSDYLQLATNLGQVLGTFPDDEPMRAAVRACRGLRLVRQDPWECLASFILSSTKQIIQIRQIIGLLCERFGEPVTTPLGQAAERTFPSAARLARATETELRACKMGFRAPYLLGAAQQVAAGELDLVRLPALPLEAARARLMQFPGVGRKIADCVLLFGSGFPTAFPVDVWVLKALRELYFRGRQTATRDLHEFAAGHFGANAGYAQQYLFHYMRTKFKVQRSTFKVRSPADESDDTRGAV